MDSDSKRSLLGDVNHLKNMVAELETEVKDIPEKPGALYYSPGIMQISRIEDELRFIKGVLKEFQDEETEYTEMP